MNKNSKLHTRMALSAQDFYRGVRPRLEEMLGIDIHHIENPSNSKLFELFDKNGIDAFYFDEKGRARGLASRMNYHCFVATRPAFSFRYGLWVGEQRGWNTEREFFRLSEAVRQPEELILAPKLHVESYSREKGSGKIGWSFGADTVELMKYIHINFNNEDKVRLFQPRYKEKRKVLSVCIESYAKEHSVIDVSH